ncbi:MAG: mevalonate kinase [Euryarchaeota archaeon]|nr:mevalonate kinase [Euryarchaeota archaeon]
MQVMASAPGKAILFGEHAVVYGKPAIAIAVDRKAYIQIQKRDDDKIYVNVRDLGISGYLDMFNDEIIEKNGQRTGILKYILESLKVLGIHHDVGMDIKVDIKIPIGAGLGSSAAVTVATIMAVSKFSQIGLTREQISKYAHEVELKVQNAASPIDTTISTYGGAIYLSKNSKGVIPLNIGENIPLVVGYTDTRGNTGKLVEEVRFRRDTYPEIIDPLLESIGTITDEAKIALLDEDEKRIGELMNINHGFLDALGVNTRELSEMVYLARSSGALGSKITGAGGGGSIIAYCPGKVSEVYSTLNSTENAFKVSISRKGVEEIV